MKKIAIIIASFFWVNILFAQKVNLETGALVDTNSYQINTQRVEIIGNSFGLKYDYQENSPDVLSLVLPKIVADSLYNIGIALMMTGDDFENNSYVVDLFGSYKIGKLTTSLELGRILNRNSILNDFGGGRLAHDKFTIEAYIMTNRLFSDNKDDSYYAWMAYHPEKFFASIGISDKQYWFLGGTKNLNNFGNFVLFNYNPKNGNFWFRNQAGFGKIDQGFFNQNLYIFAMNYLIIPAFHFQHFSPVATKGTYSLKINGLRTNGVHNYELAMGKDVGFVKVAVGINTEYIDNLRLAPSLEVYKDFRLEAIKIITELRYDFLYQNLSVYLIVRY